MCSSTARALPEGGHPPAAGSLLSTDPTRDPEPTSPALVDAYNVGRAYQRGQRTIPALVSATCRIDRGDRIAVIGPSGSGKSTLLHLLGGLDAPTSGSIIWPALGRRSALRPAHIAFVFQAPSLLPSLTVIENVALPLLLGGVRDDDARRAAHEALERIDLAALAVKLPEEISGGQAQRVAVARALAARPALILADEPTGQLDHPTAGHLFDAVFAALAGSDTALVVATHDRAVAERMPAVWRMERGLLHGSA